MSSTNKAPQFEDFEVLSESIPISRYPSFLRNKLRPLLPWSLPLYRRCQFYLDGHANQPRQDSVQHKTGDPELWVVLSRRRDRSTKLTAESTDWFDAWVTQVQTPPSPTGDSGENGSAWLACHIDLREPGQTQVWTFGSWEATTLPTIRSSLTASGDTKSSNTAEAPRPSPQEILLGQTLFHHLREHHVPALSVTPSKQYLTLKASGKIVSDPFKRTKVLFGTISEASYWLLEDDIVKGRTPPPASQATKATDTAIAREDRPYYKYIIPLPLAPPHPSNTSTSSPSPSFTPGPLQRAHIQTVVDRTSIPRSPEMLATLVSVGLFPAASPDPVAWGVLGKDASISSVHTEPAYRGQRLAERVTRELIRVMPLRFRTPAEQDGEAEGEDEEVPFAHVDVSESNVASQRVFERMGAKIGWRVGWIEVDIELDEKDTGGVE